MAVRLDHTIVPATDKTASARFFAELFGLTFEGVKDHFAPVRVNEALTLDFEERPVLESHHYAFHISDEEFDAILGRVKARGLSYGSGPFDDKNGQINSRRDGRGFYFKDPNGHLLEVMTVPETGS